MSESKDKFVGRSVTRLEDRPLLLGQGRFAADVSFVGQLYMRVVRSTHANAKLISIDTAAARATPGVHAVWTAADVADIPPIDFRISKIPGLDAYRQRVLASGRVRYVGDPVAAVFAEDPYLAEDVADRIVLEVEELPPLLRAEQEPAEFEPGRSTEPGIVRKEYGDIEAAFRNAHSVVSLELRVGRHSGVPLETRGAIGRYDGARDVLELHGAAKVPHWNRDQIARMLGIRTVARASLRRPCRRWLRYPRRALSGGRSSLRGGAPLPPAGEVDRGSSRAPDRRQPLAPAAASHPGRH